MQAYMHVCICGLCTCMPASMSIYACTYASMSEDTYVCTRACVYIGAHACMHTDIQYALTTKPTVKTLRHVEAVQQDWGIRPGAGRAIWLLCRAGLQLRINLSIESLIYARTSNKRNLIDRGFEGLYSDDCDSNWKRRLKQTQEQRAGQASQVDFPHANGEALPQAVVLARSGKACSASGVSRILPPNHSARLDW